MRTLNLQETAIVSGGTDIVDPTAFMSEGIQVYSNPDQTITIVGHREVGGAPVSITFADGAIGTLIAAAARGALTEFVAGFALGSGVTLNPGVGVAVGVAAAAVGIFTAWAVANAANRWPLTAEP